MHPSLQREWIEGAALAIVCPTCRARRGELCTASSGRTRRHHEPRLAAARARRATTTRLQRRPA